MFRLFSLKFECQLSFGQLLYYYSCVILSSYSFVDALLFVVTIYLTIVNVMLQRMAKSPPTQYQSN